MAFSRPTSCPQSVMRFARMVSTPGDVHPFSALTTSPTSSLSIGTSPISLISSYALFSIHVSDSSLVDNSVTVPGSAAVIHSAPRVFYKESALLVVDYCNSICCGCFNIFIAHFQDAVYDPQLVLLSIFTHTICIKCTCQFRIFKFLNVDSSAGLICIPHGLLHIVLIEVLCWKIVLANLWVLVNSWNRSPLSLVARMPKRPRCLPKMILRICIFCTNR